MVTQELTAFGDTVKVLYIDDDPTVSDRVQTELPRECETITVVTEATPSRALDAIDEGAIDCVVSEHRPPDVDGLAFLETVRAEHPHLPFVLFPSEGSERLAGAAVSAGVTDYLPRDGTKIGELADAIEQALLAYQAERQATDSKRVATVVQSVTRAVVQSETRDELERTVCNRLAASDPYLFAWCGRYTEGDETLHPYVVAGDDAGYLDDVTVTTGEERTGRGPAGAAIRTGEMQVAQDVREDPSFDPWREAALERGVRAAAAVPIVYEDTMYGVLGIYADRPWAFDEAERKLLSNLGDSVAHGLHLLETRNDLQTYRKAVEHAGHSIYITKPNGAIEYVNPQFEEVTGYSAEEAIGSTPSLLKSGMHSKEFYRNLWRTILSGDVWTSEIVNRRKDGSLYHVNQTIAPITDSEGNIDRFVAVNADITDEKRQQQALERQNERLNEFTSIVSHDLRNPLNIAKGRTELVRQTGDTAHLDDVESALERMECLIEDLLRLSQQGETLDDVTTVNLERIVTKAWKTAETADAALDVTLASDAVIHADEGRLVQVFENLFRNAVEHGHDEVTVTVGTTAAGIFVEDDGPGIPDDEREAVFDRSFTTGEDGNGLGLPIVQTIIEAHGWNIRVDESESGGARFEIDGVEFV